MSLMNESVDLQLESKFDSVKDLSQKNILSCDRQVVDLNKLPTGLV